MTSFMTPEVVPVIMDNAPIVDLGGQSGLSYYSMVMKCHQSPNHPSADRNNHLLHPQTPDLTHHRSFSIRLLVCIFLGVLPNF